MQGLWASIQVAPSLQKDPLFQKSLRRAADELELARTRLNHAIGAADGVDEISKAAVLHFKTQMISLLEDENRARTKIYLSSIVERVEVGETESESKDTLTISGKPPFHPTKALVELAGPKFADGGEDVRSTAIHHSS